MKNTKALFNLKLAQIAWVVPDISAAERFLQAAMGLPRFERIENFSTAAYQPTYYGKPGATVSHLSMTWAGGSFIELIQPISGASIFRDYLDKHPAGGIQHIAFSVPVTDLDKVIASMINEGYEVVASYDTPIAKIVFFDTTGVLGVMTEIMGITEEGVAAVEQMKGEKTG